MWRWWCDIDEYTTNGLGNVENYCWQKLFGGNIVRRQIGGLGGYMRDDDVEEESKYIWVDTAFWAVYTLPGFDALLRAVDAHMR